MPDPSEVPIPILSSRVTCLPVKEPIDVEEMPDYRKEVFFPSRLGGHPSGTFLSSGALKLWIDFKGGIQRFYESDDESE